MPINNFNPYAQTQANNLAQQSTSVDMPISIFNGCCQNVSLVNTSTQDILVSTPLIEITRPDLVVTY